MGFDVENFGLGLLVGWASAYGVYRARHVIRSVVDSATQGVTGAQTYAVQNADRRYINDIVRLAQASHLAGRFINLTEILVEPRFIPAPPLVAPPDDDVVQSIFHLVPFTPDFPDLLAPYNVPTLSIDDLSFGQHALALLGNPGSGRTTALWAIALRSLGQAQFKTAPDKVQQRLDAEEAAMDEKQRAVRIKERVLLEQRAKEQFAKDHAGAAFDTSAEAKAALPLLNRLMPVYIHLADIDVRDQEFSGELDPAEPLVRAVQRELGRIAASTIPRNLYQRLSQGQVLLLVDGYDDLPESERSRQLAWLSSLMTSYPDNFFIVAGPSAGYGLLTRRLGLTPLFLRPWSDRDREQSVNNWLEIWPRFGGKRRLRPTKPDPAVVQRINTNNRALSPLELSLKIWANLADDAEAVGYEGWIRAFLARHLPADQALGLLLPQLQQAALLQLDEGYITEARLTALLQEQGHVIEAEAPPEAAPENSKSSKKPEKEQSPLAKRLSMLARSGLLTTYIGGRYRFRHDFVTHYIASLTLKDLPPEQIAAKAAQPVWSPILAYAALHRPIDDAVRIRSNAPANILYTSALEIARWLPYAGADVSWRVPFLKFLTNLLLSPSQYPLVRERAAAALLAARDKSALQVFRQALRSPNAHLRRLGCLGLGALGDPDAIQDLSALLKDADEEVQITAALGLSALRTEAALTVMVEEFTEGSERLRQAIAETLADIPAEGHPVLADAIQDEDMLLRRAAVFGLKRVTSPWALIAIYRAFLEDQQWYVRSAAQLAFQELQYGGDTGPQGYPLAESIQWLNEWAARRGENVPTGEGANQMLLKALNEGEAEIRVFAASDLGQLGVASTSRSLYAALCDKHSGVRDAAHRALAELQMQIGKPLPAP